MPPPLTREHGRCRSLLKAMTRTGLKLRRIDDARRRTMSERGKGDVGVLSRARLMHSSRASVDSLELASISCRIRALRRRCFIGYCSHGAVLSRCRRFCRFSFFLVTH